MSQKKLTSLVITIIVVVVWNLLSGNTTLPLKNLFTTISPTISPFIETKEIILGATDTAEMKKTVKVVRVIDGDTIEIEGGKTVRYIGIDTPETKHPTKGVQCFGKEATAKNKELVEGKQVRLEKDISETDRYGRLLRYVYVDDTMVNKLLVAQGYAVSSSYPPDIKYQDVFLQTEKEARNNNLGLWSSCKLSD